MEVLHVNRRVRIGLPQLMAVFAVVAIALGALSLEINRAWYDAAKSSYGGRRMTREQAREIGGDDRWVDRLPDSEFLPEP